MVIDQLMISVGVSIGIACYPQAGMTAKEIVEKADVALYGANHDTRQRNGSSYRTGSGKVASLTQHNRYD